VREFVHADGGVAEAAGSDIDVQVGSAGDDTGVDVDVQIGTDVESGTQ
jgi:hypothetical protein